MAELQIERGQLGLLDVLEQLPRETIRESLWLFLTPDGSLHSSKQASTTVGRAFRLTCQRTRGLADQLCRRLTLDAGGNAHSVTQTAHGAFLAQQEGLEHLALIDSVGEDNSVAESLVLKTLLLGGTTCQRLRILRLDTLHGCTPAVGVAVQRFCPALQELQVKVATKLDGAFILPLRLCEGLNKVCITSRSDELDLAPAMRALAALPSLRTLSLHGRLAAADMTLLAALTGLTDLHAGLLIVGVTPADAPGVGRALGGMLQLVHLVSPFWETNLADDEGAVLNAVAEQLTGLRRLQSLSIGQTAQEDTVFDHGFDALRVLSQLTQLTCPALSRQHQPAAAASFTGLQHLLVCSNLRGPAMTASLRPLPGLPKLSFVVYLDKDPADDGDASSSGLGASDLWQATTALAARPGLLRVNASVFCKSRSVPCRTSAHGLCTGVLLPLRERLTGLYLSGLSNGIWSTLLPVLHLATRLEKLRLSDAVVSKSGLLLLVGLHSPGLRRLWVSKCKGVHGDTAVALAEVRLQPLHVQWESPVLTVEEYREFRAVARYGVVVE